MAKPQSARCRGSVAEVVLILLLILVFASLWIRPWPDRDYGRAAKQHAQFSCIDAGLGLFRDECGEYLPSRAIDDVGQPYCGAMKLAEALVGRDLLGFHIKSEFRADGLDPNSGAALYPDEPDANSLKARVGPFLPPEWANAHRLVDIYGKGNTGPFREGLYVLCDMSEQKRSGGAKTGMPILYHRANPTGTMHDPNDPDNPANIYNYRDNLAIVSLGVPGDTNAAHPLADPKRFYLNTENEKVTRSRPHCEDSYILISAGWDGLYGTADDICNFNGQYRE